MSDELNFLLLLLSNGVLIGLMYSLIASCKEHDVAELTLKSRRVVPGRLLGAGFSFEFPHWPLAARDLVDRWRAP